MEYLLTTLIHIFCHVICQKFLHVPTRPKVELVRFTTFTPSHKIGICDVSKRKVNLSTAFKVITFQLSVGNQSSHTMKNCTASSWEKGKMIRRRICDTYSWEICRSHILDSPPHVKQQSDEEETSNKGTINISNCCGLPVSLYPIPRGTTDWYIVKNEANERVICDETSEPHFCLPDPHPVASVQRFKVMSLKQMIAFLNFQSWH